MKEFKDDGRSFADMNIPGMRGYDPDRKKRESAPPAPVLTRKERRAMLRAAFLSFLPALGFILLGFGAAIGIVCLWLT